MTTCDPLIFHGPAVSWHEIIIKTKFVKEIQGKNILLTISFQ